MRVYKPAYTKPLPAGAKIKTGTETIRRQKFEYEYVTITGRQGEPKKCRIKDTAQGKRIVIESSFYTVVFRDHTGTQRRLQAYPEQGDSEKLGKHIGSLVRHRDRGAVLSRELDEWLDELEDSIYDQLADYGLVRPRHKEPIVSGVLGELLADFADYLKVWKHDSERHISETVRILTELFEACGFTEFADIDHIVVERHIADLRKNGKGWGGRKGLSVRTVNRLLRAAQQFCRWAVKKRKVASGNPLDCLDDVHGTELDVRRRRRALTTNEIFRLLRTTVQEPERFGMNGRERCLLYRMGFTSGLRANELRCLRVRDFDFDDPGGATVTVQAAYSKTRKKAVQPLDSDLAKDLQEFILARGKEPGDLVFCGRYVRLTVNTARMIRADIEAAGLEYDNEEGTADFHCLRHTFTSSLEGDDSAKQSLTRHATRAMLDRYDHREALKGKRAVLARVKQWGVAG